MLLRLYDVFNLPLEILVLVQAGVDLVDNAFTLQLGLGLVLLESHGVQRLEQSHELFAAPFATLEQSLERFVVMLPGHIAQLNVLELRADR